MIDLPARIVASLLASAAMGSPEIFMKIPTSERLAKVLEEHGLYTMAKSARDGYYDDFQSPLATPIAQLVLDLFGAKQGDLARRAMGGEWDGTKEEAQLWWACQRARH